MSNNVKNSTTTAVNVVCAIVFLVFVFCYIWFYQTDILALAQHVWSSGQTHYDRNVGAVLITLVFCILTFGINVITKFPRNVKALIYLPALMLLGVLTSAYPSADGCVDVSIGSTIFAVIALIVFGFVAKSLSEYIAFESPITGISIFSKTAWTNFGLLAIMLIVTCIMGNSDGRLHRQLRMERLAVERQYNDALEVGKNYQDNDSSMTMLRAYCLAAQGKLGENLFEYPLYGGSKALLPTKDKSVAFMYNSCLPLWRLLGAVPGGDYKNVREFFLILNKQKLAKSSVTDYDLSACLMDCNLDAFAKGIKQIYDFRSDEEKKAEEKRIEKLRKKGEEDTLMSQKPALIPQEQLPKHYREALVLYTRTRSQRVLTYTNNVVDADYDDYLKLERKHYNSANEKEIAISSTYAGTYWYYYWRNNKKK